MFTFCINHIKFILMPHISKKIESGVFKKTIKKHYISEYNYYNTSIT